MASATENRFVNLYINGKQVGETYQEIRRNAARVRNEIERGKLTQEQYNEKVKELAQYNSIIQQHSDKIRGVNRNWTMLKSVMLGVIGGNLILTAFQKITSFIPNLINQNAKLADSFADVRKTTGLTEAGMSELNLRLKAIDTRTGRQRLLELARDAGKLGIQGAADIAGFVKAADQINVALGEDLGEDAITTLGKLNNLFGTSELYGYEQGLLKLGSVINELGANSEAQESAIVDFTSRLAGVAVQADLSFQDLSGMGAQLDSLGQRTETSATAISQAIVGMFSDTETYAKIANKSVDEFSTLLKKDANEAFIAFLDGLNGNNDGLAQMAKRFDSLGVDGSRAIQVLGALAGNTEGLRKQQALANKAYEEGTSLTNEFTLKNNNLAGTLDKIGKRLGSIWINSSLVNGVGKMVTWFEKLIRLPVDQELNRQRVATMTLGTEIVKLNIGSQERIDKINQLKKEFPNILGHLNSETVGNQELLVALQSVNAEYVKRILLARKQEELEDLGADQADALMEENERMEAVQLQRLALLSDLNSKEQEIFLKNETQIMDFYRRIQDANASHSAKVIKFQNELDKIGIAGGIDQSDITSFNERLKEYEAAQQKRVELDKKFNQQMEQVNKIAASFRETSAGAGTATPKIDDSEGGVSTVTEADEKILEEKRKQYEKLLEMIRTEEEKLSANSVDGRAKEELLIKQHFDKLRMEAQGHSAELIKIAELEREALRQIDEKYGREYDNERREAKQAISDFMAGQGISADPEVAALEAKFAEMIELARKYGVDTIELEKARTDALIALKENLTEKDKELELQKWQQQVAMYQMAGDDILNGLKALNQGAADENARFTEFIQQVGLVQMGIAAGVAIANAIKSASTIPWPGNLPAMASAIGAVLAFMGQAKQVFNENNDIPEYALGTMNYSGSYITGDQGRELHQGAKVIPADITQSILAANAFNRTMPQPNFSAINDGLSYTAGRQAQDSGVGGGGNSGSDGMLMMKIDELIMVVRKAQDKRVVITKTDLDRFDERYQSNSARVGMKK